VILLDRAGNVVWTADVGEGSVVRFAPDGATVFAATRCGEVLALDAATGAVRWRCERPAAPEDFDAEVARLDALFPYQTLDPPQTRLRFSDYYVLGPFDNPNRTGFATAYPPEQEGVNLEAEYEGKGGQRLRWRRVRHWDDPAQVHDLFALLPHTQAASYVARAVFAPRDLDVVFSTGSDDTITLWVNGEQVLAQDVYRPAAPNQELSVAHLRRGRNELLLKITQDAGLWGFYLNVWYGTAQWGQAPLPWSAAPAPFQRYVGAGDPFADDALERYQRAAAGNPTDPAPHACRGEWYAAHDRWDEALAAYQQAVTLAPGDAELPNAFGVLRARRGYRAEAATLFRQALSLDPTHLAARTNLGLVLHDQRDGWAAMIEFNRVLARSPNHPPALYGKALVYETVDLHRALPAWDTCLAARANVPPDDTFRVEAERHREAVRLRLGR
jgi:tetratricopeptide (TPR) repeat protein